MYLQQQIESYAKRTGQSRLKVKRDLRDKMYPELNGRIQQMLINRNIRSSKVIKHDHLHLICKELDCTPNDLYGYQQKYLVLYEIFNPCNSQTMAMHQVVESNEMLGYKIEELKGQYGAMLTYLKAFECGNEVKIK